MEIMKRTHYLLTTFLICAVTCGLANEYLIQAKPTLLYSQKASAEFGSVSPSGKLLWVSRGRGSTIHEAEDGTKVGSNPSEAFAVSPMGFIDEDRHVVAGGFYAAVYTLSGSKVSDHYGTHSVISPDKDRVFTGKYIDGSEVKLVMLGATGTIDWEIRVPGREIYCMDYHPNGQQVAVALSSRYGDHTVLVLNADDGGVVWRDESARLPSDVAFSPDGKTLAAVWSQSSQNRQIKLTETKRYKKSRILVDGLRIFTIQGIRWSPDSKTMGVNVSDPKRNVYIFRVKDGRQLAHLKGEDLYFNLDFTANSKAFLTVHYEKNGSEVTTIGTLRRTKDGKKLKELRLDGSTTVGMGPDGRVLFDAGPYRGTRPGVGLLVGKKKRTIPGTVYGSFIDPTGTKLVTTHGDHYKVWKL